MKSGLSVQMGWKAATSFIIFAFLRTLGFALLSLPLLYSSFISFLVSIASHPSINFPILLGKNTNGSFPIWSLIIFSPYLYYVRWISSLKRLKRREPPYTEVSEGLYVGGWPSSPEKMPSGDPAIIDCTCELPRVFGVSGNGYLCIPTWDTRSPDPDAIESAVLWGCRKRAQNTPVFIHCASGHGRSVVVMCALLVALGVVDNLQTAEKLIGEKRPNARIRDHHHNTLQQWSNNWLYPPLKPDPMRLLD
ncbi:uncharacterized protein LOC112525840 isoform X1 [Cynara cardunculus var. scolymus]|uniref:uncharacterized protein LOC112525840 isoform X1 n=1 Tax=Cynara cardunculus var. scolymus TaxID=59895 RepID=UPI000D62B175|nr:uncharacterized protein LOC112525840 isoform X1 [Cynara cardunculus var. scolymus]